MFSARLFVVLSARRFIAGARPERKFRTTDEADTAHVVSGLPTARRPCYIVYFLPTSFKSSHSLSAMRACDTAYFESMPSAYAADIFITLSFVALINIAINFGYKYFCFVIYFFKIFFVKNFFSLIFFWELSMPLRLQRQNELYVSVLWKIWYMISYMICKRSKSNFRLVRCVRYSSSDHTAHIALDVKSLIFSLHRIIIFLLLYFFRKLRYW